MTSAAHEVVISPDGEMSEEHADLLRKRLLSVGFHEDVVSVRSIDQDTEHQEADP